MTSQDYIQQWLDEPTSDYEEGVYLFSRESKNNSLKNHFSKPENDTRRAKLVYELRKLLKQSGHKPKVYFKLIAIPEPSALAPTSPKELVVEDAPELKPEDCNNIKDIVALKNQCFKNRENLRSKLSLFPTDNDRYEAVLKIMEFQEVIKDCWYKIDHHEKHGRLPHGTLLGPELKKSLTKRNRNLRTYISKLKTKIESTDDTVLIEKWQDKLDEYESERNQNRIKLEM